MFKPPSVQTHPFAVVEIVPMYFQSYKLKTGPVSNIYKVPKYRHGREVISYCTMASEAYRQTWHMSGDNIKVWNLHSGGIEIMW
jgi:hypothetical protein